MKHKLQAISMLTRTLHLSPPWASLRQFTHIHHILMLCSRHLDLQGVSFLRVFLWEIFVYFFFVSNLCHVPAQITFHYVVNLLEQRKVVPVMKLLTMQFYQSFFYFVTLNSDVSSQYGAVARKDKWRPPSVMAVFRTALVPAWDHRRKTDSHPCSFWGWSFSFIS